MELCKHYPAIPLITQENDLFLFLSPTFLWSCRSLPLLPPSHPSPPDVPLSPTHRASLPPPPPSLLPPAPPSRPRVATPPASVNALGSGRRRQRKRRARRFAAPWLRAAEEGRRPTAGEVLVAGAEAAPLATPLPPRRATGPAIRHSSCGMELQGSSPAR
jgi:hypothetical protein